MLVTKIIIIFKTFSVRTLEKVKEQLEGDTESQICLHIFICLVIHIFNFMSDVLILSYDELCSIDPYVLIRGPAHNSIRALVESNWSAPMGMRVPAPGQGWLGRGATGVLVVPPLGRLAYYPFII